MRKVHHAVPDDCVRAIGLITVNFAILESEIKSLIGLLLLGNVSDQRLSHIVTEELSFKKLCDLLGAIFRYRFASDNDKIEKLDGLIKRARCIEDERNKIVHSLWGAGPGVDKTIRFKTTAKQKGLRHQFEVKSVVELNQIAEDISILSGKFMDFMFNDLK